MLVQEPERVCLSGELARKFSNLWLVIGNTPMLRLHYKFKEKRRSIFVKCEQYNLTGSIKDRMALYILQHAYKNCKIKPGDTIIEATSGNTGISFAAIGKALGHKVKIIMPDWLSRERREIIKSLGAEVILVSREDGGFLGCIELSKILAEKDARTFLPRQFDNEANLQAHKETTAPEIWIQLQYTGLCPDAFIAGVGTGGTVMGIGSYFRKRDGDIKVHPLEPSESPTLTTGYKTGNHRIQGISDEFIPRILQLDELDKVIQVHDGDAIIMAQMLASQLGMPVGISSGANVLGALKVQELMGKDATVVTVFPDSNKKYLSTDLMREEPVKEEYLSPHIKLTGYELIKRLSE